MFDHTLRCARKNFCSYCFQAFRTEEILKLHIKDCFKVNGKQRIIMPKKGKYDKFKLKSSFMIYPDFESILVPENNGKQNEKEFSTKKYQNQFVCNYCYKLVCVDNKFSKPFKTYLGRDAVYN